MFGYILGRLLRGVPLLLGLSVVVFSLIHAAPGGPLTVYLSNPNVRPEDIARLVSTLMSLPNTAVIPEIAIHCSFEV